MNIRIDKWKAELICLNTDVEISLSFSSPFLTYPASSLGIYSILMWQNLSNLDWLNMN